MSKILDTWTHFTSTHCQPRSYQCVHWTHLLDTSPAFLDTSPLLTPTPTTKADVSRYVRTEIKADAHDRRTLGRDASPYRRLPTPPSSSSQNTIIFLPHKESPMCPKFWTHGHISHQPTVSHVVTNVSTGHIFWTHPPHSWTHRPSSPRHLRQKRTYRVTSVQR